MFAVDYVVRLELSGNLRQFIRTRIVDLLAVILPIFPAMRMPSIVTLVARRSGASGDNRHRLRGTADHRLVVGSPGC